MKAAYLAGALLLVVLVSGCVQDGVPLTGGITGAVVAKDPEPATIANEPASPTWETVAEFSGTGTYPMTERFAPTKANWRYIWTCSDSEAKMKISVFPVGSKLTVAEQKVVNCPNSGSMSVQGDTTKEYYARLHLTDTKPGETHWTFKVEQ
jgi:hypothetical protein